MDVSRRQFFKICAGGMAGTTVAALGFAPKQALAQARNYKLLRAKSKRTRVCHKIIRLRKLTYLNSGRKTHHCLTGQLKKCYKIQLNF